jgi:hypothetical protein
VNEVEAPALVGYQRYLDWTPSSDRPLASTAPAHIQPLLAVEALYPLAVDELAFPTQQHMEAAIAEPPSPLRKLLQPLA